MINILKKDKINFAFLSLSIVLLFFSLISLLFSTINNLATIIFGIWSLFFLIFLMHNCCLIANIKLSKKDIINISLVSIFIVSIYGIILMKNKDIYTWDRLNYYLGELDLIDCFHNSFFKGIFKIISSTFYHDYGLFLSSFNLFPFMITNLSEKVFIFCYSITILVPIVVTFYINIKKIMNLNAIKNRIIMFLCVFLVVLFPLLHKAAIDGQPDFVGLIFINLIILLTIDFDFTKLDIKRCVFLSMCIFCLVISRRWYMFWLLGYGLSFFCYVLYKFIIIKKSDKKVFIKNITKTLIIIISPTVILLLPMWIRIIKQDFSNYVAWNIGGYILELNNQQQFIGLAFVFILIMGMIYGLVNKNTRKFCFLNIVTLILSFVLFVRTQNMWYHQSLLLYPCYIYIMVNFIILVAKLHNKIVKVFYIISITILIILNFSSSIFNINNKLMTNISLSPVVRNDYDEVLQVTNFIVNNTNSNDLVYINTAGFYAAQSFRSVLYPNRQLDSIIVYESSIDNVHGFPIDSIAVAKYIIVSNVTIESTGAKPGHIIPAINDSLNNDSPIKGKFKLVKEFKMNDEIVLYCYERITEYDKKESDYWKSVFEEQTKQYPELFGNRIDSFDKNYLRSGVNE